MGQYRLIKSLDSRGVSTVIFDVDNTLFATGEYFKQKTFQLGVEVAQNIDPEGNFEEIARDIDRVIYEEYERSGKKPSLIVERYLLGLREYLGRDAGQSLSVLVREFFKDFYLNSPVPFDDTPKVLNILLNANKKVGLHSHAQDGWTKVKVDVLTDLIGYELPYLATDIEKQKDSDSWLKAFELVDSKPQEVMVVGDNFESDILPPVEVGCKNATYLNRYSKNIPKSYEFDDSVQIIEIEKIADILSILL